MPDEVKEEENKIALSEDEPFGEGDKEDQAFVQAKDLINTFIKTIKAFRLYPPENPSLIGFRDQIFRKFQAFLKQHHSLFLKIEEYTFSFKGKTLYENRDLKASIAFLLYKDGLREIRFMEGLDSWELEGLIDILKRTEYINQLEDDLVTLIWEKDFVHIGYLATDEFLDEMAGILPENMEQLKQNFIFDPAARNVELDLLDGETDGEVDYYEVLVQGAQQPPPVETNRNVYFLTPEELVRLRKEVEAEVGPHSVFNVIDILFEILALEKDPEPFQDAVNVLIKLLEALLNLGNFQKAADLLTRANIILKTYELKDWQVEKIQSLVDQGGDPQALERIGVLLEKGQGVRWEELNNFLLLLGPKAVKPLIQVLGDLNNSKARRLLCDVIYTLGKNNLELITPYVDDPRWYLARNVTYILGRIGKEPALPAIQKALSHKEVRVRREAVQALGQIGGDLAFSLLAKVLADEDVRVRSMAALNLAKVGKTASQPYLLEIIQSREFSKKEPSEKKAFMDAMGMIDPKFSLRSLPKMPKGSSLAVPPPTEKAADGLKKGETTLPSPGNVKDQTPLASKGNLRKETRPSPRVISAKRSTPVKPARKGVIWLQFFRWLNPFHKKE